MAKITGLKRWLNGETFSARAYMYEREAIISLLNAHDDLIQAMVNIDPEDPEFKSATFTPGVYTQGDITEVGRLFYDNERHSLTYLTDLGEYIEIGSNLGGVGKNLTGNTWEGQPVTLTGITGASPTKEFKLANASSPQLSDMVGVLTTSTTLEGILPMGELGKISVFGDVNVPDISQILDSNFLTEAGVLEYKDLPFGTKLYLSTEPGKYSYTVPLRPNQAIWVATLVYASPDNMGARIFVYPHKLRTEGGITIHYGELDNPQENDLFIDYD